MSYKVFSPAGMEPDAGALIQMDALMKDERAVSGALMADHHLGYSMPIGGVVAYQDAVSPTGVGFDIGCGNKATRTNLNLKDFFSTADEAARVALERRKMIDIFKPYMRLIQKKVAFGLGRSSEEKFDHPLFDSDTWGYINADFRPELQAKARDQLGTVGSGNHYVDLLVDEKDGQIWVANHFGSRGLGHTIASGFMAKAAGKSFTDRVPESEEAVVLSTTSELGQYYIEAMKLAGEYAYAGRGYVMGQVLSILGAEETFSVHNHHNFAWLENGLWVVRKGATPLTREPAFIGGSMGDVSVIVRGEPNVVDNIMMGNKTVNAVEDIGNLGSAPHGAGRVMSRTKAAGKFRKFWICPNRNCQAFKERAEANKPASVGSRCPECTIVLRNVRMRDEESAAINWTNVHEDLTNRGITVLGAGADESPGVYKNLSEVLAAHANIEVMNTLHPIGVVMAGEDTRDPYKD